MTEQALDPARSGPRHRVMPANGKLDDTFVCELSADFNFVSVPDHSEAISVMAFSLARTSGIRVDRCILAFSDHYDSFVYRQRDTLAKYLSEDGRDAQIVLLDPHTIERCIKSKIGSDISVTLNTFDTLSKAEFGVSRLFSFAGREQLFLSFRPGSATIAEQVDNLARRLRDIGMPPIVLVDDHAFSCGTLVKVVDAFEAAGITIKRIVTHTQVGSDPSFAERGIEFSPVVKFVDTNGGSPIKYTDLVEFRYFLVGAGGCSVRLPSGDFGRVPYILPFCSPAARASVPAKVEGEFSEETLRNNLKFYKAVSEALGCPVQLKHAHPLFRRYMHQTFDLPEHWPMERVVAWAFERRASLTEFTQGIEHWQKKLVPLDLPKNMVLVDINGTLLEAGKSEIPALLLHNLRRNINRCRDRGIEVGLCSDSPLEPMRKFARDYGFNGPLLAENGNLVEYRGMIMKVRSLPDIDAIKNLISLQADRMGLVKSQDILAPEFGGRPVSLGMWAFGAERSTSLSVFGPPRFIESLGELELSKLLPEGYEAAIDCNPRAAPAYGFFAVHPIKRIIDGKRTTLELISQFGRRVLMVGDGPADLVQATHNVMCAMVYSKNLPAEAHKTAWLVSDRPNVYGVIDILGKVIDGCCPLFMKKG